MFFRLSSAELGLIVFGLVVAALVLGQLLGRRARRSADGLQEPLNVLQGALLGLVGLILAFGLALAVGRYDTRRGTVVDEANAIGTAYLRAQTLAEPQRGPSLALLVRYADEALVVARGVPGSDEASAAAAEGARLQRDLWALAGAALNAAPEASAPRLYVESLNELIDMQTVRLASLGNRVPTAILGVQLGAALLAMALLAAYMAYLGRGQWGLPLAAVLLTFLVLVTFDLDRPSRGLIRVPATALVDLRASMELPPAAAAAPRPRP